LRVNSRQFSLSPERKAKAKAEPRLRSKKPVAGEVRAHVRAISLASGRHSHNHTHTDDMADRRTVPYAGVVEYSASARSRPTLLEYTVCKRTIRLSGRASRRWQRSWPSRSSRRLCAHGRSVLQGVEGTLHVGKREVRLAGDGRPAAAHSALTPKEGKRRWSRLTRPVSAPAGAAGASPAVAGRVLL